MNDSQKIAILSGKIREMVMRAEMVKQGITRDTTGACSTIVDLGRTALANIGTPMPPVPSRLTPPTFGTDERTGMGPQDALRPPTAAEQAITDAIHAEPSEPLRS